MSAHRTVACLVTWITRCQWDSELMDALSGAVPL